MSIAQSCCLHGTVEFRDTRSPNVMQENMNFDTGYIIEYNNNIFTMDNCLESTVVLQFPRIVSMQCSLYSVYNS